MTVQSPTPFVGRRPLEKVAAKVDGKRILPIYPHSGISVAIVAEIQSPERIWHEALTIQCEKQGTARAELVAAPDGVSGRRWSTTPETRLLAPVRVIVKLAHVIEMQGSAQPVPPWESEMRVGSADGSCQTT